MEKEDMIWQMEADAMSMIACLYPPARDMSAQEFADTRQHIRLAVDAIIDEHMKDVREAPEKSRIAYIEAIMAVAISGVKRLRKLN